MENKSSCPESASEKHQKIRFCEKQGSAAVRPLTGTKKKEQ